MGISTERMAEETRDARLKMHELVEQGKDEMEALGEALPDDKNRSRKLKTWKKRGLWPMPQEEMDEHGQKKEKRSSGRTRKAPPRRRAAPTSQVVGDTSNESAFDPAAVLPSMALEFPDEFKAMIAQLFALHRAGKLAEMDKEPEEPPSPAVLPPMPKLSMKPSSVYLSVKLMEMAEKKAQEDPTLPAGTTWTRSALVSYLVWQYCGCPTAQDVERG
jgi:hypothetical protein